MWGKWFMAFWYLSTSKCDESGRKCPDILSI
jgi:hypothetical protein